MEVNESESFQVYGMRWFILAVICIGRIVQGWLQGYVGTINSEYAQFFEKEPWQIDWLVTAQAFMQVISIFPITFMAIILDLSRIIQLMILSDLVCFVLSLVAIWFNTWGYYLIVSVQVFVGISNAAAFIAVFSASLVWFPSHQVTLAISILTAFRGLGEALGTYLPTRIYLFKENSHFLFQKNLLLSFTFITIIVVIATIFVFVMPRKPPTHPSAAAALADKDGRQVISVLELVRKFNSLIIELCSSGSFWIVAFSLAVISTLSKTYTVLLTSLLSGKFENEDVNSTLKDSYKDDIVSSNALTMGWILFILGGFLISPLITKYKRYKEISTTLVGLCFLCNVITIIALLCYSETVVVLSIALLFGLCGASNVTLFKLYMEVTYPLPQLFTSSMAFGFFSIVQVLSLVFGRLLLDQYSSDASFSFHTIITFISFVVLLFLKPVYNMLNANESKANTPLLPR